MAPQASEHWSASDGDSFVNAVLSASLGEVDVKKEHGADVVSLRPPSATEISKAVLLAGREGGRVSVTTRLRPGLIALDLSRLNEVGTPDEISCLIRVGAGAKVREVEARAIQVGLTLGPLLPSSPYKSVGAWLAGPTRGERAIPPGRLETAALSLDAVLADGSLYHSKEAPRSATGPDLDHLLLGSEGRFGVITQATLRLFPRALVEASGSRHAVAARDAIDAICTAARAGLAPVEARWDRAHGILEARFAGTGAAGRARRFGHEPVAGSDRMHTHLELAGSWQAWGGISPLRPQGMQFMAIHTDGAFGAVQFESADEADQAAQHARAIGLTIVSPRRLRPAPDVGWASAKALYEALTKQTDPHGVFAR